MKLAPITTCLIAALILGLALGPTLANAQSVGATSGPGKDADSDDGKPKMPPIPGEEPVDVYAVSNANAGTAPFAGTAMLKAFHGREGIDRIVDDLADRVKTDKRTTEVFHATDMVRLRRTLKEQFCYILGGGCDYTGRAMADSHKDQGVDVKEFNALVEILQEAMDREHVAFAAQNRLLAKLAPMKRDVVRR